MSKLAICECVFIKSLSKVIKFLQVKYFIYLVTIYLLHKIV